jgi:hypothetical protein
VLPTPPVAPTIATRPDPLRARRSPAWSWTIAAVNAWPLVTATSVRWRSDTPPAVTEVVSAPRPTTEAPRPTAWSTDRATRSWASLGWAVMWPAPYGTTTTCPRWLPSRSTEAIDIHGTGRRRGATSSASRSRGWTRKASRPGWFTEYLVGGRPGFSGQLTTKRQADMR